MSFTRLSSCAVVAVLALCAGCGGGSVTSPTPTAPLQPQSGSVQGVVMGEGALVGRLKSPNRPLAGVEVVVLEGPGAGAKTETDDRGAYNLSLPPGPFRMRWSRTGYQTRESTVWLVEAGATTSIFDIVMPLGETLPPSPPVAAPPPATPAAGSLDINITTGRTGGGPSFIGHSVTIPGTSLFSDISFYWYNSSGQVAFGTLYLLSREYLGFPTELSSSTAGFIATATATVNPDGCPTPSPFPCTGGEYRFPPNVTLAGGAKYWLYTDRRGTFLTTANDDPYLGGDFYFANTAAFPFIRAPLPPGFAGPPPLVGYGNANFRLQGVPLPGSR